MREVGAFARGAVHANRSATCRRTDLVEALAQVGVWNVQGVSEVSGGKLGSGAHVKHQRRCEHLIDLPGIPLPQWFSAIMPPRLTGSLAEP